MNPPSVAIWLLAHLLPPSESEPVIGDLVESFHDHVARRSPHAATLWFWRETLRAIVAIQLAAIRAAATQQHGDGPMMNFFADLHMAWRLMSRRPGFTVLAVLTLALGIGATTGVFSIVNGVLLRPLPYPESERLLRVFETAPPAQGSELRSIAIPTLLDWRRDLKQFDDIALFGPTSFAITGDNRPEQLSGATATASLFTTLGVRPLLGRVFTPDEEHPGGPLAIVLSHRLWQRRFAADSSIVGKSVRLDRKAYTVVGVMPAGFAYPANAQLWASIGTDHEYDARGARHMSAIARVRRGVTASAALAELLAEEHRLAATLPKFYAERGVRVIPLAERIVGGVRPALLVLTGAVVLVLLIACVNVANLLLARATTRRRELALRTALGASRSRIVRQLLVESMTLFLTAALLGFALATLIVRAVRGVSTDILPRADAIQLDAGVLFFAIALALVTGVLFGLIPALQASAPAPASALLEGGRGSTSGRRSARLRGVLIAIETALAAMLLVGAGLLVRSMQQINAVDPGLSTKNVLTFGLEIAGGGADPNADVRFFREVRDRIATIPGVRGVGLASRLPLSGADHSNSFYLPGEARDASTEHSAQDRAVSAGYFAGIGIRVRQGREFTDADAATSPPVVMVNEAFAHRYFPNENPVGRQITPTRAGSVPREIVGVVADTKQGALDDAVQPEFYIPHTQDPWPFLNVAVRTAGDPMLVLSAVQDAVWSLDRDLPLNNVLTLEQMTAESGAQRRLVAMVLMAFAGIAYLLAAIGLYGVIAYTVTQRTAEIGIRMALGAQRGSIGTLIVGSGVRIAMVGALTGLALALPMTRWLRGLLFGVTSSDPATYAIIAIMLPAIAIAASAIPAARAMRIDPVRAMRE